MQKNNSFKIIYCIAIIALTIGLSFAAYHFGKVYNIHSRANILLDREIAALNSQYKNITSEKELLEKQKNELNSQLSEKSHLNKEIEESTKQLEQLNTDIDSAKEKIKDLDNQILEKKNTLSKITSISSAASGKKLSLKEGTYSCPKNISPGRYTIKGNNTLLIYTESNTLKISEDLSRLDGNSFTFDIEDGEKIKITSSTASSYDR